MDKELLKAWLTALRSGKYKQGKGRLRNTKDEYCCMGVLADVIGHDEWRQAESSFSQPLVRKLPCYEFRTHTACLPTYILPEGLQETLMSLNDYENKSFCEIADYIGNHFNVCQSDESCKNS